MNKITEELQSKIINQIKQSMPITAGGKVFNITDLKFVPPSNLNSVEAELKMKYEGKGSIKGHVKGKIIVTDQTTGEVITKSPALSNLVPVYAINNRGVYVVNGSDKAIRKNMRLKPGVYTSASDSSSVTKTEMYFQRGTSSKMPRLVFSYNSSNGKFMVTTKLGTEKNYDGINFLRQLGFSDMEIQRAIQNATISDTLFQETKADLGIADIYKSITGKQADSVNPDVIRADLFDFFSDNGKFGEDGEKTLKSTIGTGSKTLDKTVILNSVRKLFGVIKNPGEEDNREDLRYKDVLDDNDLMVEQLQNDINVMKSNVENILKSKSADVMNYTDFYVVTKLGNSIDNFMMGKISGDKAPDVFTPEGVNPLYTSSVNRQLSQVSGDQGISKKGKNNVIGQRNLKGMGMNRIDPIETPESSNLGLVERVSQSGIIKNKTIYAPVYKVSGKVAKASPSNIVELSPEEEYDAKVAYFNSNYVERDGDRIIFTKTEVKGRYKGKDQMLSLSEVEYVDTAAQNIFSYSANMIPFVNHDDGNRALMGTNMQRDSMVLKNREIPFVMTSVDGTNKTYEELIGEEYGKPVRSTVNGTVSKITNTAIVVVDDKGKSFNHPYYRYFKTMQGNINNELKVKKGDVVKVGQILAEGWQTVDGKLAMGVNARTGYLSYKGYNNEDGIVISNSFAKKMEVEEVEEIEVMIPETAIGGKGSGAKEYMKAMSTNKAAISKLDADGIIKQGEYVKPGDVLCVIMRPRTKAPSGLDALLSKGNNDKFSFSPFKIPETSYVEGKVERVTVVDNPETGIKEKLVVTIVSSKPMKVGDKMSGKHGNKGTITLILPDDEMPTTEDGKNLEVIFSPLAIPSRKNPGQLLEVGAGLVAEKEGKTMVVNNFSKTEKDKVVKGLKDIGVPDGKMKVVTKEKTATGEIKEIPVENPITVGNMYVMRLNKQVDDKIQARSNYEGRSPNPITFMPSKEVGNASGEKHNPQSIGEMEFRVLQSHGAVRNILESSTIKADGGGDREQRLAIFSALKTGNISELDMPATPGSLKVVADTLKGFNLDFKAMNDGKRVKSLDDAFNSLALTPLKGSEFLKAVGANNEVTKSIPLRAKADSTDVVIDGGYLDPKIFGDGKSIESRSKWGYIKLASPMPNPVLLGDASYDPYSTLTGKSRADINKMMSGSSVMILDPDKYTGALISGNDKEREEKKALYKKRLSDAGLEPGEVISISKFEELEEKYGEILWKAGGDAIQFLLDDIDVSNELKKTKKDLDTAKGSDIDKLYKKYKMLDNLKKNKLEAADLMVQYVPVTPLYMREVISQNGQIISPDINVLYGNLIKANTPAKDLVENGSDMSSEVTPDTAGRISRNIYNNLKYVMGTEQYVDVQKGQTYKGLKQLLGGKQGLVRNSLLRKRVDFSGRSVIGIDPNLKINEAAIPLDMAKTLYKPFIYKELLNRGYAANMDEAESKVNNMDYHTKKVLDDIAKDRPIILNRQPSLHKQSALAFNAKIKDSQNGDVTRNIQLNPLVVTGFNADFDGDQMAAHVPITEAAKEEAKAIMMPTNNFLNNASGDLIFKIRQEMIMGIYYLTQNALEPVGKTPRQYGSYNQLRADWWGGAIKTNTAVTFGIYKNMTAGYLLYILLIPTKYRHPNWNGRQKYAPWKSKDINAMFKDMTYECDKSNGKTISMTEIAKIMDDVKKLGFDASTKSGVSIGINDFKKMGDTDKMYSSALKEVSKTDTKGVDPLILASQKVEKDIEDRIKAGELGKDNPVDIILSSGARGNPGQFRKIMGTVGTGADVTGKMTLPVQSNFVEGLSPDEYWNLGSDSRKGVFDRSVASFAPGKFTRELWAATQDVIIVEKNCKTKEGIRMISNNSGLVGRTANEDVVGKKGVLIAKKGQIITKEMYNQIYADDSVAEVKIRSSVKCKSIKGVCQTCYGAKPGTVSYPEIGTAVGVIASQSFGEPLTQGTLNTFHTGGANAKASQGLPLIEKITNLTIDPSNKAVIAKNSGKITKIDKGILGSYDTVYINEKAYKIPHLNSNRLELRVDVGDNITKGDSITVGTADDIRSGMTNITSISPKEVFDLQSQEYGTEFARDSAQDLVLTSLTGAVDNALGKGTVDQRHIELVVGKMTSKAKVIDGGDSRFIKGEVVDKNILDKWNSDYASPFSTMPVSIGDQSKVLNKISKDTYRARNGATIVTRGMKITPEIYNRLLKSNVKAIKVESAPIVYENILSSKGTVTERGNQNFFSNLGTEDITRQIAKGVTMGEVDKLDDPRGRLMTGKLLNIGSGFNTDRSIGDTISSKIKNLFAK